MSWERILERDRAIRRREARKSTWFALAVLVLLGVATYLGHQAIHITVTASRPAPTSGRDTHSLGALEDSREFLETLLVRDTSADLGADGADCEPRTVGAAATRSESTERAAR